MKYDYKKLDVEIYLQSLYTDGLKVSSNLSEKEIQKIILNTGIFRFKGYVKAFRNNLSSYSIDDIIAVHDLDKKLSSNMFTLTSSIEIKLKSYLIETVYSLTDNPFCYLLKKNYKEEFALYQDSIQDWEVLPPNPKKKKEVYLHYRDYYLNTYDFDSNKNEYMLHDEMIEVKTTKDINYPPFHYFIENATLGTLINTISKLQIGDNDILKLLAKKFNFYQHDLFLNYLLRLKELRNRCAHNGRIFNRNFRALTSFGDHKTFRKTIYEHKMIDVYYTLHVLLDNADNFKTVDDLINKFVSDNLVDCEEHLKQFMIDFMRETR